MMSWRERRVMYCGNEANSNLEGQKRTEQGNKATEDNYLMFLSVFIRVRAQYPNISKHITQ